MLSASLKDNKNIISNKATSHKQHSNAKTSDKVVDEKACVTEVYSGLRIR